MKQSRHQARTVALQALYPLDIQSAPGDVKIDDVLQPLLSESDLDDKTVEYARDLAVGTWSKREQYDQMITDVAAHWKVSRMAVVDRNILRLALYELVEHPDVPARVVIDEAIEIGRQFGDAETPQFINGVLDAIWKKHPACRIARGAAD